MWKKYVKQYLFLSVGLFIMSIGIAFSIKADLGTSPISSPPYVISLISGASVGTFSRQFIKIARKIQGGTK